MKTFTCFKNEVGPELPKPSVLQTCILQECNRVKTESELPLWPELYLFGILAECWIGAVYNPGQNILGILLKKS